MVVFGSVIILIIVSMVLLGVSGRMNAFHLNQSEIGFIKTEACLEEALIRLSRDNGYTGNTYYFEDLECIVNVGASGDERTISLNSSISDYHYDSSVLVQVAPAFAILDFSY